MGRLHRMEQHRKAVEREERPFRPPNIDRQLADAVGIPGVVYKNVPGMWSIRIRKRGRLWLWTGIPLWLLKDDVIRRIQRDLKDIRASRTSVAGLDIPFSALRGGS